MSSPSMCSMLLQIQENITDIEYFLFIIVVSDQYQYMGSWAPTPPLIQRVIIS